MTKKTNPEEIVAEWTERNLTIQAAAGKLARAFEVDDLIDQLVETIQSERNPILTGEAGIGKTAAIYELVHRIESGAVLEQLRGKQVIQLSLRQRASGLKRPFDQMRPEMQRLVAALLDPACSFIPYFRDLHLAYTYDLEPQLQLLAYQSSVPILGEGEQKPLQSMFETTPELSQQFVSIHMEEPSLEKAEKILLSWSKVEQRKTTKHFLNESVEEALFLAHRFLARDRLPRKALDLLIHTGSLHEEGHKITRDHVIERFCHQHRVPRLLIDPRIPMELQELEERFLNAVLGQEEAVAAMVKMISMIKSGLSDMRRPFGAFLFVGPTGVGKTHLAKFLAEVLFGSRERIIRMNMADYQDVRHVHVLFGDPHDDRPVQNKGVLTARIVGQPFAVLLLDEFEKAHPKVHDSFLQLIDEGAFINGAGETVSCRSMIIILTSNTGAEVYRGKTIGFNFASDLAALDLEVDRRLANVFRIEFLNRFDQVVHFHPLSRSHIRTIALRELEQLKRRVGIKQRRLEIEVDESVLDWITIHGYDPNYGARFLRRTVEKYITTALSETIVRDNPEKGSCIELHVRRHRIHAQVVKEAPLLSAKSKETVLLPMGSKAKIRNLNLNQLLSEAQVLLNMAENRLKEFENARAEASNRLEEINSPDFWDRKEEREAVLARYRELDVAIRLQERFARPILELAEICQGGEQQQSVFSRLLEQAAEAYRQWETRMAEEGHAEIWMIIGTSAPSNSSGQWIRKLSAMESGWCRQLGLNTSVVAYAVVEDELSHAILEIEGPGAEACLAMEGGNHRIHLSRAKDVRISVEVIKNSGGRTPSSFPIRSIKPRRGMFEFDVTHKARLNIESRGLSFDLFSADKTTLERLLPDLNAAWHAKIPAQLDTARQYGKDGVVHDPRTGVTSSRIKDVWKGRLDVFLEGWRRYGRETATGRG